MADTPETPETAADDTPPPARRGRPARKTASSDTPKRAPAKRASAKRAKDTGVIATASDAVESVEERVVDAAKATRRVASRTAKKTEDAVVGAAGKAGAAVGVTKPRSSKRSAAAPSAKSTRKSATSKSPGKSATEKVGGKWGAAAIAGGVVAAAGAAAALLTLRGSAPKPGTSTGKPNAGARQADGTDSSKSFAAGIADEGTIPNA